MMCFLAHTMWGQCNFMIITYYLITITCVC
uniref:Uncharacterized protein n=1 Tax=Anguilla anguilla TaxID=7936 RepID=A0A0E9S267_ANGAN